MAERLPQVSPGNESLFYGCTRGLDKALDDFLKDRDPVAAKRRRAKSSAVRGQMGVIRQAAEELLVAELHRRYRLRKKREGNAERQRVRRQRLKRQKA